MISYEEELQIHQSMKIPTYEGWYFRVTDGAISIAIWVGIVKQEHDRYAYLKVYHSLSEECYYKTYKLKDVKYQNEPFSLCLEKNVFNKHYIHIELDDDPLLIDLELQKPFRIEQTKYAPTIMGPLAYLKNSQWKHSILSLGTKTTGSLKTNKLLMNMKGYTYIDKDWGQKFPERYFMLQSHSCLEKNAFIVIWCASLPFKVVEATGLFMNLLVEDQMLTIASYLGAIVTFAKKKGDAYYLTILQGQYMVECTFFIDKKTKECELDKEIYRCKELSLFGELEVKLFKFKNCIEVLTFENCAIETQDYFK